MHCHVLAVVYSMMRYAENGTSYITQETAYPTTGLMCIVVFVYRAVLLHSLLMYASSLLFGLCVVGSCYCGCCARLFCYCRVFVVLVRALAGPLCVPLFAHDSTSAFTTTCSSTRAYTSRSTRAYKYSLCIMYKYIYIYIYIYMYIHKYMRRRIHIYIYK